MSVRFVKTIWVFALLVIVTLAGNSPRFFRNIRGLGYLRSTWGERGYRSAGDHVDLPRVMIERHAAPDASVYLVCIHSNGLSSVERSLHLAVSWAMCPTPVRFGYDPGICDAEAVLGCAYGPGPEFESAGLDASDFERVDEGGGTALWMRRDRPRRLEDCRSKDASPPSALHEGLGLLPLLLLSAAGAVVAGWAGLLVGVLLFSLGMAVPPLAGFRPTPVFVWGLSILCFGLILCVRRKLVDPEAPAATRLHRRLVLVACVAFFALVASMALVHTFRAPNGLGVSGGRARLLYVAGGLPNGVFADPARSTLQPAYPPGLALLTLGCDGAADGCGEWLTQLLGVFGMTAVLFLLGNRMNSPWTLVWLLAAFLNPLVLQMASLFYSEPFMALFVLVGWERLRGGRDDDLGWILVGASGWFKNEGLILLLFIWIALRFRSGASAASARSLQLGLALPVAWHVACRMAGAHLNDFAPIWQPDFRQMLVAAGQSLKLAFLEPWRYGCVYPLAVVVAMLHRWRKGSGRSPPPSFDAAGVAAILCIAAFSGIFALSAAADFDWHLWSSLSRLLWVPSLLLLRELAEFTDYRQTVP